MKLYRHLAWDGIRKNSRLYVPYLLTGVGAVSFFYILVALSRLPEGTLPGSGSVQVILNLGSFVLWVFSLLLLFYTHSFLIRRRNREFALYNVLGMGKRDIARILCWETLLSGGISLAGGLALGILLGKLAELGLLRMVGAATDMVYRVSAGGLLMALGLYGAIYLLILISSLLRVRRSTAIQLMRSQAEGEKPPRANWALAVLGILLLAGAYYLAVTHPGAAGGPDLVLRRRADGHCRHLSAVHLRLRDPVPPAAKESPVLLPEAALRVRFLPGIPHEAQRRGPGLHLHPGHYGAGDALLHHLPVFRRGGLPAHPLSPG